MKAFNPRPSGAAPEPESKIPAPSQGAPPKTHVLVVDQKLSSRMELRMALHGAGYHVAACASGAAARQALKAGGYGLAIIDNVLPDCNVQELLREIRFQERETRLPIILLTGGPDTFERTRASKLSVDEVLSKPCDMIQLLRVANKLTHGARPTKAQDAQSGANAARKFLVAHGDPVVRRAFVESFRADGATVIIATSTDDSFSTLANERVDAVIVDYLLPPLGCLELCRAIRKNAVQKGVPLFVMVSPGDDPDAFRKAKAAGADELLVKTQDMGVLRNHVREVMSRLKRERAMSESHLEASREGDTIRPPSSRDPLEDSGSRPVARPRTPPSSHPGPMGKSNTVSGSTPPPPSSRRAKEAPSRPDSRFTRELRSGASSEPKRPRIPSPWPKKLLKG